MPMASKIMRVGGWSFFILLLQFSFSSVPAAGAARAFTQKYNLKSKDTKNRVLLGGEGGIRTREPVKVTHIPSVRDKPDYATSPISFSAAGLYHKGQNVLVFF